MSIPYNALAIQQTLESSSTWLQHLYGEPPPAPSQRRPNTKPQLLQKPKKPQPLC